MKMPTADSRQCINHSDQIHTHECLEMHGAITDKLASDAHLTRYTTNSARDGPDVTPAFNFTPCSHDAKEDTWIRGLAAQLHWHDD